MYHVFCDVLHRELRGVLYIQVSPSRWNNCHERKREREREREGGMNSAK